MPKDRYKYLIWNSSWYKKNAHQSGDWSTDVYSTDSESVMKPEKGKKQERSKLQSLFPWWRQER